MSAVTPKRSNIYEALLLQLAPLIYNAWSYRSIDKWSSVDYHDYEDYKEYFNNELASLKCYIDDLNKYLVRYFKSIYHQIRKAPEGLSTDVAYGVPMHKVFECLVAAEFGGHVVGGKGDGGIDVINRYDNFIIQCKSGKSYSSKKKARMIYEKLIKSCIDTNTKHAVLAVTDAGFPPFNNYPDLESIAEENGLNIELKRWKNYGITHPPSPIYSTDFDKLFDEFNDNLQNLLTFLKQIQRSIGQQRRIHWDDILEKCIHDVQSIPNRFNEAESSIFDNLNSLQTAYEDDDSMEPWEKAWMEGNDRSNSDSENGSDDDQNDTGDNSDDNPEDIM